MRHYAASQSAQANTAAVTLLHLVGTASVRPRIYECVLGSAVAPVDQAASYTVNRTTAAGTLTAVTPQALDSTDPAASSAAGGKPVTTEPTYTAGAVILQFPLHQRPTYRWLAYDMERALVLPASAAAGAGLRAQSVTTAFNVDYMIHFGE